MVNGSRSVELIAPVASSVKDAQNQSVRFRWLVKSDVLANPKAPRALTKVALCQPDVGMAAKIGECLIDSLDVRAPLRAAPRLLGIDEDVLQVPLRVAREREARPTGRHEVRAEYLGESARPRSARSHREVPASTPSRLRAQSTQGPPRPMHAAPAPADPACRAGE